MAEDLTAVQLTNAEIKYALEHDAEFFIQFFMGDKIDKEVPAFHVEIFNLMINLDVDKFACAMPRDHAKTTLAKLACIWFYLFSDFRFIVYLSNTVGIAIPSTNDIVGFLQSPNFEAIYGPVKFETLQDGKGVYKFWLGDKLCFLRAFGLGQQVRGINIDHQRPQLAILDDIDAVTEEVTETSFKKSKKWFYGPFRKALDKAKNKMVQIGNLTENESLIAKNCQSRFWHSRVYGCILADGSPLWPDFWTIEKLQLDYQEYQEAGEADTWFAEMMNMPSAGGRGIILAEEIFYQPHRLESDIKYGFITIDLAISKETWAHQTVIAVHGWVEEAGINGCWQAVDYECYTGIDPIPLFWEVMRFCKKWHINTVGIEAVAFQAALKPVFEHECLRNNIAFNAEGEAGKAGIAFVQLKAIGHKTQRIFAWASMIKAKEYSVNESDYGITQQLITYRPDRKLNDDDLIDAFAYAPQMFERWLYLIMQEYKVDAGITIQGSAQICDC